MENSQDLVEHFDLDWKCNAIFQAHCMTR